MTDELKPCPLTWAIQRLNSTPYSLTKDECVDVLRGLRDEIRALTAAQPAQAGEIGSEWQACVKLPVTVHVRKQRQGEAHVSTREGITPIKPDDLIMRGVSGEEYPIGRDIFEQTYRLAPTQPAAQTDSMGMPTSCGKPLCLPDEHHPLCKLHKPAAQDTPEPTVTYATVRAAYDELHIECRFSDGQKFAAVTVAQGFDNLAHRIETMLNESQQATPEPGCARSHPHEDMSPMCELRTEIARLRNENAYLKATAEPVAGGDLLHHPHTPRKADFDALYLHLCSKPITHHEVARRCWKAALSAATPEPVGEVLTIEHSEFTATRGQWKLTIWCDGKIPAGTKLSTRPAPGVPEGLPAVLTDWGFDVHDDEEGRTWLTIRNPDDDVARMSVPTVWPLNGNQTIGAVVLHQFSAALTSMLAAAQAKGGDHA